MTLREATDLLLVIEEALELTYPGAFKKAYPGATSFAPRFGWEVRLRAGSAMLQKATMQLRGVVAEAEPQELLGRIEEYAQP